MENQNEKEEVVIKEEDLEGGNNMKVFKSMFCEYLGIGLSLVALALSLIGKFLIACSVYEVSNWLSFFAYGCIAVAISFECIKFVMNRSFDYKGSAILVFAIAIVLF